MCRLVLRSRTKTCVARIAWLQSNHGAKSVSTPTRSFTILYFSGFAGDAHDFEEYVMSPILRLLIKLLIKNNP